MTITLDNYETFRIPLTMGFRGVSTAMRRQIINNFRNSDAFINVQDSWWQARFPGLI